MTTVFSQTELNWLNMPADIRDKFYQIASEEGADSGFDLFAAKVPFELQDNPFEVETILDGGTIVKDGVTYEIGDKDFSRIDHDESYTTENVVLEDSSLNRSRQDVDMTSTEIETAEAALQADAELIDGAEIINGVPQATEAAVETTEVVATAAEAGDSLLEVALDGVLPITYGAKAAQAMWESTSDMPDEERVAVTALAGGAAVGTTYAALALVPGRNLVLGGIALYKLGEAGYKMMEQQSRTA